MLKSVTLKNFRKHTDREFIFTKGLNIIRGANEGGKTTINEAIGYAWFGTDMLRESLADVVTYGQPENSLSVDLLFELNGVDYRVIRSGRGAEIIYGDQRITGKTETRRFMENLFGCTADTVRILQMAGQNEVRGVLEDGGTGASALVEKLAKLGVIEDLIEKVQNQLPNGNTKSIETLLGSLRNSNVSLPPKPGSEAVDAAKIAANGAFIAMQKAKKESDDCNTQEAQAAIKESENVEQRNKQTASIRAQRQAIVDKGTPAEPAVTEETIAQWQAEQANDAGLAEARRQYAIQWPTLKQGAWIGSRADFAAKIMKVKAEITSLKASIQQAKVDRAGKLALIINEKECAFCKKDLSDVPEVALRNAQANEAIEKTDTWIHNLTNDVQAQMLELATLEVIEANDTKIMAANRAYWNVDETVVPAHPTWIGEPPAAPGAKRDIKGAQAAWIAYRGGMLVYENAVASLAELVDEPVPDVSAHKDTLALSVKLKTAFVETESAHRKVAEKLTEAQFHFKAAMQLYKVAIEGQQKRQADIDKGQAELDKMVVNNELIKALRAARPQIATQLWSLVLTAISYTFSQMRGEASIVAKTDRGFTVNGKNVKGLSGSTLDILGLAIRVSLSKVFLPNVPFLSLDEPFAGCSDERETDGYATIASAGFDQTLVVTHSDIGDALADNLVAL